MEKLKLEHLKGYLGCGLKGKSFNGMSDDIDEVIGCYSDFNITLKSRVNNHNTVDYGCDLKDFKPILFPLDYLTKYREDLGFVPIVELGCLINDRFVHLYEDENGIVVGYGERTGCGCPYDCDCGRFDRDFILKYNEKEKCFYSEISIDADYDNIIGEEIHPSFELIQKLHEWKFDIHGLIEKNLAIAVTEDFNPYK